MKLKHLLLLLLCLPISVMAQKSDSTQINTKKGNSFLRLKYQAGTVLLTNDFLAGNNEFDEPIDYYQSLAIEYGKQTFGQHDWEHAYNFPKYGIGLYSATFFNTTGQNVKDYLGRPSAIYGFFEGPFGKKRDSRWLFGYRLGFGLTYNWNPYDPVDNPFQIAIGSKNTVYIEAALKLDYEINDRWMVGTGAGFTHFSNGASSTPNYGINLMAPYLMVQYNFNDNIKKELIRKELDPVEKVGEVNVGLNFSSKQIDFSTTSDGEPVDPDDKFANIDYLAINLTANWMKRVTQKSKFGVGLDLTYDESINAQVEYNSEGELEKAPEASNADKFSLGGYVGYELVLDRLSLLMNAGAYILRKDDYPGVKPVMYQRIGLKYRFYDNIFAGVYVRAYHFSVADYLEWQIGYRFGG
ncbi:acyloxyacyl hydrolase [Persicobacter diffluens]|uniref:Acyloxyacyl hydrolase n=1 Tax=Persicobacter diffluens TaxID=981 RepID=A0AAN4W203_9BACT|nr:hypothetical protein PEDI_41740 [Persicobacter diffluens]